MQRGAYVSVAASAASLRAELIEEWKQRLCAPCAAPYALIAAAALIAATATPLAVSVQVSSTAAASLPYTGQ
jgi:hypothetical protein